MRQILEGGGEEDSSDSDSVFHASDASDSSDDADDDDDTGADHSDVDVQEVEEEGAICETVSYNNAIGEFEYPSSWRGYIRKTNIWWSTALLLQRSLVQILFNPEFFRLIPFISA